MTLGEKIAALRGERRLSQGDLAEKLDVSRQSVSKWETNQAVPELDKIIKLADLFGVSVDELVREGEAPKGELPKPEVPPAAEPEAKTIYVERRLAGTQVVGAVLLVLGLLGVILGVAVSGNAGTYTALAGAGMVVLGLPLLLARKHPFLVTGWVVLAVSCLVLNPYTSVAPWGLRGGVLYLYLYFVMSSMHNPAILFAAAIGMARGLLFLTLAVCTARLCWKKWKRREQDKEKAAG